MITVFAGMPDAAEQLTDWDARCGFYSAREAVLARREEDRQALALLEAQPRWLEFADSQYGQTPSCQDVGAALQQVLRELAPDCVLFPLGLFHSDHLLVHNASVVALQKLAHEQQLGGSPQALAYEDALYRGIPGRLQQRLADLAQSGVTATPAHLQISAANAAVKAEAVQAYASQLRAFGSGGYADTVQPERCWRLERASEAA